MPRLDLGPIRGVSPLRGVALLRGAASPAAPVMVVSTGLLGTMPCELYADLLTQLSRGATIAVLRGGGPRVLWRADVEAAARALGVEAVGVFAHSSFDIDLLRSSVVERAVLLDPVAIPSRARGFALADRRLAARMPVRVLRAGLSTRGARAFVPRGFRARVEGASVEEETFDSAGHADVLDDRWADVAARAGIRSCPSARERFRAWVAARTLASWD